MECYNRPRKSYGEIVLARSLPNQELKPKNFLGSVYDWNTQAPEKSESLGWIAFKPQRIILKNHGQLKGLPRLCSVCSASSELLRLACRKTGMVDPTAIRGFERDAGLVREAAERCAYFEIPLKPVLRETGERRARTMQCYREFLALCIKHKAGFVYSSQAETSEDVKSPFEAEILLQQLGLTKEHAKAMLKRMPPDACETNTGRTKGKTE